MAFFHDKKHDPSKYKKGETRPWKEKYDAVGNTIGHYKNFTSAKIPKGNKLRTFFKRIRYWTSPFYYQSDRVTKNRRIYSYFRDKKQFQKYKKQCPW